MNLSVFSSSVIEKIKNYVYLLKDPETNEIFYVGKGHGNRVFEHVNEALKDQKETDKLDKIREIHAKGGTVKYEIIRHGLEENEAFEVEAALIDYIGLSELTNKIYGYDATNRGKMSIDEIIAKYNARTINDIKEPSILIIVNKEYKRDISPDDLYRITRGNWVMGEKRRKEAKFAFAIYNGVVRQVYKINKWDSIDVTDSKGKPKKRWQFSGEVASDLKHCVGGNVERYLGNKGAQNPIRYVNC